MLTWRLRCRIASCTALERTRSKFEAPMTRTKAKGSTILNFRKNSIALSGTFSRVGQTATGARWISVAVSTTNSTLSHGRQSSVPPGERVLDPPAARAHAGRTLLHLDDGAPPQPEHGEAEEEDRDQHGQDGERRAPEKSAKPSM